MGIVNENATEYHHLTISEIIDNSQRLETPNVKIKTVGRNKVGDKVITYPIIVYVTGKLMDYVLAELQKPDDIFVIGKTVSTKFARAIRAEYIYREDWVKFYNVNRRASLKDVQDKFKDMINEENE